MRLRDEPLRPLRTALFVDFDNIYIGLRRNLDENAAEMFATDPLRWVRWLERGMPPRSEAGDEFLPRRCVLTRRCYLNPHAHHRYRPFFTRAAFKIVDCPPLTYAGKNSADIQMVMDIIDALEHKTCFDEFVIFSGDSDFTPVLLRLRDHDRRTIVLTIGPAAEAYVAACDRVITEDVFVEDALEVDTQQIATPAELLYPGTVSEAVLRRMAAKVYEHASAAGELPATSLPRIFQLFPEFTRESNWLGFFSLRRLTERIVGLHSQLRIEEGDPWQVAVTSPPAGAPPATSAGPPAAPPATSEATLETIRHRVVESVSRLLDASDEPVAMSRAAEAVRSELGESLVESRWAGAGTFRALLESAHDSRFHIVTAPNTPGYICDPQRHDIGRAAAPLDPIAEHYPHLAELTRRIQQITGAPRITPDEFAVLFQALSDELAAHSYHLNTTSKAVRDLCIERGHTLSRAAVTWILRGIAYSEHPLHLGPEANTPERLARSFLKNLLSVCDGAQLELSSDEIELVREWVLSKLPQRDDTDPESDDVRGPRPAQGEPAAR